jgi:hypothetical protein
MSRLILPRRTLLRAAPLLAMPAIIHARARGVIATVSSLTPTPTDYEWLNLFGQHSLGTGIAVVQSWTAGTNAYTLATSTSLAAGWYTVRSGDPITTVVGQLTAVSSPLLTLQVGLVNSYNSLGADGWPNTPYLRGGAAYGTVVNPSAGVITVNLKAPVYARRGDNFWILWNCSAYTSGSVTIALGHPALPSAPYILGSGGGAASGVNLTGLGPSLLCPMGWRTTGGAGESGGYPFVSPGLNSSCDNVHEVANQFKTPTGQINSMQITGLKYYGGLVSASTDVLWATLYNRSGAPLAQGSLDINAKFGSVATREWVDVRFTSPFTVQAGSTYYLGFCASSTNGTAPLCCGFDVPLDIDQTVWPLGSNVIGARRAVSGITTSAGPTSGGAAFITDNVANSGTSMRWGVFPLYNQVG